MHTLKSYASSRASSDGSHQSGFLMLWGKFTYPVNVNTLTDPAGEDIKWSNMQKSLTVMR
jgi:hypothetical protein